MPPADLSLLARLDAERSGSIKERGQMRNMKNGLDDSSFTLREVKGGIDTLLCFRRWKSESMECGREWTSAGERKAAGEGFLKGQEQIDVECRFSTQVSKGKALENINRTLQRAKGQIVFKKTNRGGWKIYSYLSKFLVGGSVHSWKILTSLLAAC